MLRVSHMVLETFKPNTQPLSRWMKCRKINSGPSTGAEHYANPMSSVHICFIKCARAPERHQKDMTVSVKVHRVILNKSLITGSEQELSELLELLEQQNPPLNLSNNSRQS